MLLETHTRRAHESSRMPAPGQNMSCCVLLTLTCATAWVTRSSIAVYVLPYPPTALKVMGEYDDQVSTCRSGQMRISHAMPNAAPRADLQASGLPLCRT